MKKIQTSPKIGDTFTAKRDYHNNNNSRLFTHGRDYTIYDSATVDNFHVLWLFTDEGGKYSMGESFLINFFSKRDPFNYAMGII